MKKSVFGILCVVGLSGAVVPTLVATSVAPVQAAAELVAIVDDAGATNPPNYRDHFITISAVSKDINSVSVFCDNLSSVDGVSAVDANGNIIEATFSPIEGGKGVEVMFANPLPMGSTATITLMNVERDIVGIGMLYQVTATAEGFSRPFPLGTAMVDQPRRTGD